MSFAFATALLLYRQRRRAAAGSGRRAPRQPQQQDSAAAGQGPRARRLSRLLTQVELLALGALAVAVGYARVHLGYHTWGQVAAGAAVGAGFALLWHGLAARLRVLAYPRLERLSGEWGLWFRDTLGIEDVHLAEYQACSGSGMAAKQKPA